MEEETPKDTYNSLQYFKNTTLNKLSVYIID